MSDKNAKPFPVAIVRGVLVTASPLQKPHPNPAEPPLEGFEYILTRQDEADQEEVREALSEWIVEYSARALDGEGRMLVCAYSSALGRMGLLSGGHEFSFETDATGGLFGRELSFSPSFPDMEILSVSRPA